jgi:hypothetical protein
MGFKGFLKGHWGNIVSITIGIIGLLLGVFFYFKSVSVPEPVFLLDPVRTSIVDSGRFLEAPLRVVDVSGKPIRGDVSSVRFYFWNNGRASVHSGEILEPITVTLSDPNGRILDYRVLRGSRGIINPTIVREKGDPNRRLRLSFDILEESDGFSGQIIYEGEKNAIFSIKGILENARRVLTNEDLLRRRLWVEIPKSVGYLLVGFLVSIISISFIAFFEERRAKKQKVEVSEEISRDKKTHRLKKHLLIVCISIIIIIAFGFLIFELIKEGYKEAERKLIETVPRAIIQYEEK